jgi:hypothetical protein
MGKVINLPLHGRVLFVVAALTHRVQKTTFKKAECSLGPGFVVYVGETLTLHGEQESIARSPLF